MKLHSATPEQIRSGDVTDVYFPRSLEILRDRDLNPTVRAEFVAKSLPEDWDWAVFTGLEELLELAGQLDVTVRAMPEGTLFGPLEPVLEIEAPYREFCVYETAFLGFLCQATGVATGAARCRLAAGDLSVVSFGARRLHPSVAPVVERAAYLGGCDGVATVAGAELIGIEPSGTMPHALILVMGDTVEATRAFDEVVDPAVPRVSLIDTFQDEKFEAVRVAEELGDAVDSLRLDTPGTRRGDFHGILEEVRWELDLRGHEDVQLFASGGIGPAEIRELDDLVDGFGVGGAISAAPIVDFSMDIVEIEGRPFAKRGKWSGSKQVFRCVSCGRRRIATRTPEAPPCPSCGGDAEPLLVTWLEHGERRREPEDAAACRERVLDQLAEVDPLHGHPDSEGDGWETGSEEEGP